MTTITSSTTIAALHVFSNFGLPEHIVTDNGAQFISNDEFGTFLRLNILHTKTAPTHPVTNGLAERYVGHFKTKTTQMKISNEPLSVRLDKFLFTYRATPATIGKSPAELLMNLQSKTRVDLLRQKSLQDTKQQVKIFQDHSEFTADFKPSQAVLVLNSDKGAKCLPGIILKEISPRNYEVQVEEVVLKRHCTHIGPKYIATTLIDRRKEEVLPTEIPIKTEETIPAPTPAQEPSNKPTMSTATMKEWKCKEMTTEQLTESKIKSSISKDAIPEPNMKEIVPEPRYPRRERRKPDSLVIEL